MASRESRAAERLSSRLLSNDSRSHPRWPREESNLRLQIRRRRAEAAACRRKRALGAFAPQFAPQLHRTRRRDSNPRPGSPRAPAFQTGPISRSGTPLRAPSKGTYRLRLSPGRVPGAGRYGGPTGAAAELEGLSKRAPLPPGCQARANPAATRLRYAPCGARGVPDRGRFPQPGRDPGGQGLRPRRRTRPRPRRRQARSAARFRRRGHAR